MIDKEKSFDSYKQSTPYNISKATLKSEYVQSYAKLYGYDINLNKENIIEKDNNGIIANKLNNLALTKEIEKVEKDARVVTNSSFKKFALVIGMIGSFLSIAICVFALFIFAINVNWKFTPAYYDLFGKIQFIDKYNIFINITIVIAFTILVANMIYFIKSYKAIGSKKSYKLVFIKICTIVFSFLFFIIIYSMSMMDKINFTKIITSHQKMALISFINLIIVILSSYFTFLYYYAISDKRKIKVVKQ